MLIRNKNAFLRGLLLMSSFLVVFVTFFMPIFPAPDGAPKTNGLVYADRVFNTLSKGSANFFDITAEKSSSVNYAIKEVKGTNFDLDIAIKNEKLIDSAVTLLQGIGLQAEKGGRGLIFSGDLHLLLDTMVNDSYLMYTNDVDAIAQKHNGMDGRLVVKTWWTLNNSMIKPLQHKNMLKEASVVHTVLFKGIEPAYNFYGITPKKVQDNIGLIIGFLVFYVIYTMWYGFAIFELFEGIGLSMSKGIKKEV